jgi:hypothetical protein
MNATSCCSHGFDHDNTYKSSMLLQCLPISEVKSFDTIEEGTDNHTVVQKIMSSSTPSKPEHPKATKCKKRNKKVYLWKRPADKPKRPACAYNLFFYLERERVLRGEKDPIQYTTDDAVRAAVAQKLEKPKRKHVKTHGQIAFVDLSKMIATRWKSLDRKDREVFDKQASLIHAEYTIRLAQWKKKNKSNKRNDIKSPVDLSAEEKNSNTMLLSPFQREYICVSNMIHQEEKKICMIQSLLKSSRVSFFPYVSSKKTYGPNIFGDVISSMEGSMTTEALSHHYQHYQQRYGPRNQAESLYHGDYEEELVRDHSYSESDDDSDDYGWNDTGSMNGDTFLEPQYQHSHIVIPTTLHPISPSECVGSHTNQPNRNVYDENYCDDLNTTYCDSHCLMEQNGSASDKVFFDIRGPITQKVSIEHCLESSWSTSYSGTQRLVQDSARRYDGTMLQNKCNDHHFERVVSDMFDNSHIDNDDVSIDTSTSSLLLW